MVRPFDELEKEYPMKLYIYDHCPFCVRARMAAGLFGADVEEVVLANDDEATPIGMIGAKQVPILQKKTVRLWARVWTLSAILTARVV